MIVPTRAAGLTTTILSENSETVSTAHVLLGLLADGTPRHGYELKHEHDERFPRARPVAFGQVYATLGRLTRDGLIVETDRSADAGPERTSFTVTQPGRDHLADWLGTIEPPAPYVTDAVYSKVVVALLASADSEVARQYLTEQRAAHTARMRELTRAKADPDAALPTMVATDYLLGHLDADLRWMQTTLARLAALRTELHNGGDR